MGDLAFYIVLGRNGNQEAHARTKPLVFMEPKHLKKAQK